MSKCPKCNSENVYVPKLCNVEILKCRDCSHYFSKDNTNLKENDNKCLEIEE